MVKADLHIHTTASDGLLTPAQTVELAHQQGLNVIAITDHDSMQGVAPAVQAAKKIRHHRDPRGGVKCRA